MTSSKPTSAARRPKLIAPPGACDTHMHFYNGRYPTAPTAHFTPPDAWIEDYRKVQERLGLERVVVVQPTTYGTDNACQLEAMAAFGGNARGVMVADTGATDQELERLTGLGVCGIRFHMLPGGALPWDILEVMAARVRAYGWHVQLQMNGREFPERADLLKRLPGALVVDHVGRFMDPVPPDNPALKTLLELLDGGRCWVKLSAPYESSKQGPPHYQDVAVEARALAKAAPERMLWASNWPHPNQDPQPEDAAMLDLLLDWVEDEATRNRILADNPAALYGF
jgi:D-galactarolactone isomerase